ncbi:Gfo/Idh/MocA family oxidoreductase [Solihabitans fulvus]|uniref:Gfo/Idh/MocA family oxidoreductase n=1 Tax=Solihabitans fulvus TaxID=1892852 RepID=A0A5B2XD60_9PSEU|nr:Gfo/Idh/MocA family oxidoreductase [Solihabitans fulvus]KAA2261607.1 Gfo/Idh/MocA family oxidoreductase [Solihabitans fulvus]
MTHSTGQDLRIGVVGLGMRSQLAEYAHRPGEGARVVAVCDTRQAALEAARARYGTDLVTTDDHRTLLDADLDGVFVLTPDHTHEEITIAFLAAGVATFVDKPLAITIEGCDRVLEAAREHGTRLYVGHNMRHMPVVLAMRELIENGAIGEVKAVWCRHFVGHGGDFYFKDWHADRRNTTSLLLQKGAHDLDVIHWLAGGTTRRVNALGGLVVYGGITDRADRSDQLMRDWWKPERNWPPTALTGLNPVVDVEDISMVNLQLDNGVLASYQQCHFTPDYWRNYTVIGTEGRLENFGDSAGGHVKVWNRRSGYNPDGDLTVPLPESDGWHDGADPRLVDEFLRFARDGGRTLTSPVAAREAVAAGCAATASLRDGGRPVDIAAPDADLVEYFAGGQVTSGARRS